MKFCGSIDAAVDVRFGGEIDDGIKLMLGHERVHLVGICDIGFEKFVTLAMFLARHRPDWRDCRRRSAHRHCVTEAGL